MSRRKNAKKEKRGIREVIEIMFRCRQSTVSVNPKKLYEIDQCIYKSKTLFNYHKELKENEFVSSFSLPTYDSKEKESYSKFNAIKPIINDIKFDSIAESRYYLYLEYLKKQKKINDYKRQVKFILLDGFQKNGKKYSPIYYKADYVIINNDGTESAKDIKGIETTEFKLKKKLFEYRYKDMTLQCLQYNSRMNKWLPLEVINTEKRERKKQRKEKKLCNNKR